MIRDVLKIRIQHELDVVLAQKRSKELCEFTGMNLSTQTKFSTAVSEICRNVYEHVGDGSIQFRIIAEANTQALEAEVIDYGRGIPDVEGLLSQTITNGNRKGCGIINSKKLVNDFLIQSVPEKGTKVSLRNTISSKIKITSAQVKEWTEYFLNNQKTSAYEELKKQNSTLIELMEALQVKNQETQLQLEEIQRLNSELDQFTYIASHDLKAPLKNILGLSHMLEDNLLDEDIKQAKLTADIIKAQALAMDKLIVDILSYSKIGRQNIQKSRIDVGELIDNVLKSLPVPKNFVIEVQALPVVSTEEVLLFQIFSNLIINAIKHNNKENGKITIGSKIQNDELHFFVEDNGPGISEFGMKRIFELFESSGDAKENTGIGLSIVKSIIKVKNSRIWVESDGKKGSVFNFTWPIDEIVS